MACGSHRILEIGASRIEHFDILPHTQLAFDRVQHTVEVPRLRGHRGDSEGGSLPEILMIDLGDCDRVSIRDLRDHDANR